MAKKKHDDTRTTAIGLARYAREYFDAAKAIDAVIGHRPGYDLHAPMSVMHNIAHSIELALKAYLRHAALSADEIISTCGHDLEKCWAEANTKGVGSLVSLTAEDIEVLGVINKLHVSTELRYIQTGFKQIPSFGPLEVLAKKLLDAICPAVGYR